MLRAGGYFICAAEPVAPFKEMEDLTQRLSWELLKEGDISIWRKPLNNSCYLSRAPAVQPSLCDAGDDPDNVWNVNLKKCITQLPENGYGANMTAWPARLHSPPNRLFSIKMDAELSRREIFKESRAETSSEPAPPPNKSAVPVNKTNFPCYFYFNGYCNKGERCSYLHGPDDGTTTWKSSKIASGVPDGLTAEKKTSAGSETGPSAVEKHPDSSETGPKAAACEYVKSKVDLHLTTNNVGEQIASHETSGSPSEEATAVRLDSLVPAECFSQGESDLSPNQSSDEEVEDNVEREDLLESSPGFDVLVDDRVEGLGHEDDHQYMPHHDMEDRELDERFAGYDFENSLEYDPSYPDMRIASDQEQDGSYYNVENHEINEHVREIPIPAHGRQNVPHKRRLSREMPFRGRGNVDLRDLLKRRRGNESDPPNHLSRRFDLSRSNAREQSRNRYCRPQGSPWMPQRLASKVESSVSFSSGFVESAEHLKKLRQSQGSSYRQQHFKDRRRGRSRPFANEPPRRMPYRERLTEAPKIFNAPKTLAQIREEKGRGREHGDSFERTAPSGVSEREDFSGPKPLSEILKDKRRLGSVVTLNN